MVELVQFNKYITKVTAETSDITIDDIKGSCCLDNRCEKKESED